MKGHVHSVQSLGAVDGPGLRYVVFLQGCPLRCAYCHNPDTWEYGAGEERGAEELVRQILRYRPYFGDKGGVTVSGGEPLAQPAFVEELFSRLRREGVHTALDTSGIGDPAAAERVLAHTDLTLLDLKFAAEEEYRRHCRGSLSAVLRFAALTAERNIPLWVRHVVVPGLTDQEEHLAALRRYVDDLPNVQKVELLPFHKLGAEKYRGLGRTDPLAEVPAMDPELCRQLQERWFSDLNG